MNGSLNHLLKSLALAAEEDRDVISTEQREAVETVVETLEKGFARSRMQEVGGIEAHFVRMAAHMRRVCLHSG